MNLDQYPIYYPYNATSPPYTPSRPHKGNDYALQEGDPVIIQGKKIGETGHTGRADGPHVHVQAGRDEWAQSPINPTPYVGKPGAVVKTGFGSEWGNYVCIRVGDVNVFYCHLSEINVKIGQEIKEYQMTEQQAYAIVSSIHRGITDTDPEPKNADAWVKRILEDPNQIVNFANDLGARDYKGDSNFRYYGRHYSEDMTTAKKQAYDQGVKDAGGDFKPINKTLYEKG